MADARWQMADDLQVIQIDNRRSRTVESSCPDVSG
jgi:hypothetical protein